MQLYSVGLLCLDSLYIESGRLFGELSPFHLLHPSSFLVLAVQREVTVDGQLPSPSTTKLIANSAVG